MKRMKKRLLAMLLALMLVVGLLPVGVLAASTAEVIGGQYEGDLTVEYRIEISQLYKLIMLNAYDVNDDTKLEGATIHFYERRGYGDSQNLLPNTAVDRANFYYYYSFSNVSDAGDPDNISGLTIKYDGKEVYINASDLRIRYDGSHTYFVESRNDEKNIVIFYDNGEATSVTKGDYWVYAVRLIDNGATVTNWPDEPETITYPFINWTYNPDGTGGVFLSNSKVNNDTEVFARKVSGDDTTAGILIHVMNDNNALLERFVELYNAKYSDSITTADINDAVLDSMKITVRGSDGSSTNPNYYVSTLEHNGWEDGYYKIYNRDVDSIDPSSQLYNKHIPIGEISSITIEAKIGENTVNVDISRGSNPGDFEAATSELDRIIILTINAPPEKPSDDDLDVDPDVPGDTGLLTNAVTVTCTNTDAEHNAKPFDLLPGSFSIGDVVYTTEGYTCTVTVNARAYVTAYSNSTENGTHALAEDESSTKTIKLVYHGNSWTVPTGATPVNFNVTCDSGTPDPDPEKPRDPNDTELRKLAVVLECTNDEVEHAEKTKTFHMNPDNNTRKIENVDGTYICSVMPDYDKILDTYNDQVADEHTYADEVGSEKTFTLFWTGEAWDNGNASPITRQVKCKTPEQPDDDGKEPSITYQDVIDALEDKGVVTIDCTNPKASHSDITYKLSDLNVPKAGFCLNKPENDGNGNWTAKVTIIPGEFVSKYSNDMNDAHKLNPYLEGNEYKTITLKWENNDWVLADQNQIPVEYTVSCDVETEIVEKPGGGGVVIVPVEPEDPTDPDQTGVSDLLETDDHIQYLFGYPDGSFGPDRNMTRAEAAQMFYNLLKDQDVKAEPAFDDVPEGAWYATPVNVMAELGIVDGVGDDKFEPNREITRAEFTTMAMRFAEVPSGGVNIFTDVAPSDWFYSYVVNSIQYGWIEGYGDGTFRPDRLITRAEVTTIVNRMLDRQADMAFVIQNRDKLTKFTDLTTEHWAYYTIVEATNEHNYKKPAIGEDWTSLKK